jgi:uncharacterized protein YcaQ
MGASRRAPARPTRATRRAPDELSLADARRIALAAQGFGRAYPSDPRRALARVLEATGVIQIDSVNVLVRSQELPLFARLGAHDRDAIGDAVDRGDVFEYWAHEASLVPTDHHRLYRWRMAQPHPWLRGFHGRHRALVERVHARIRDDGPLKAADLSTRRGPKGTWWDWDDAKAALEYLFYAGRVTTRRRDADFARVYDLPERVLPARALAAPTPPEREARAALILLAAAHMGVATLRDLAEYHRQRATAVRDVVRDLVEEGALRAVRVQGWDEPAYAPRRLPDARPHDGCALLSPFDSLVWAPRERVERLFDFHYRIEIYTPAARRRYGYYVLPVLVGDRLVGRLDLKADRAASTLRVIASHGERHAVASRVAPPIARELRAMASWLGLERVAVARRGSLARAIGAECAARRG